MYYEYEEPVKKNCPHRTLALNRGEKEDVLKVSYSFPIERIINVMKRELIRKSIHPFCSAQVKKRLKIHLND